MTNGVASKLVLTNCAAALLAAVSLLLTCVLVYGMSRPTPPRSHVIGAYATDLQGRTPHQQFNARRAAASVDGKMIAPGAVFSFDTTVGGWSADRGYLKAPVSYDGVLVDDYGGGVCETSTTIYNAALLAGLTVIERHQHTFSPSYAPVGRDAAVAYPNIDMRVRNPYPYPLSIHVNQIGHMMICRFETTANQTPTVTLTSQTEQIIPAPAGCISRDTRRPISRWHLEGRAGYHVLVYRTVGNSTQELVSDNTYMPLSAVRRAPE